MLVERDAPSAATETVRRAQQGDVDAFERLYRENVDRIYALCLRMSGDAVRAQELTQDVFVRGWEKLAGFEGKSAFSTWLLSMTHRPGKWELYLMGGQPAGAPDARCLTGRVLCIDKTTRTLRWMIDGRTVSTMAVRFGTEAAPTREGVFKVGWKSRDHVSTLYDTPMPYAMFFSGGQAVHYSADFAANGYSGASHGCVNVRDKKKIASLFDQVRTGDKVVVYW